MTRRNPSYYSITAGTRHATFGAAKAAEVRALRLQGGGSGGVDKATKDGRFFYRTVSARSNPGRRSNPTKLQRKVKAAKASAQRRVAVALAKYLKQQNPGMKLAGAKVQKLKGGAVKITPIKANAGGFKRALSEYAHQRRGGTPRLRAIKHAVRSTRKNRGGRR